MFRLWIAGTPEWAMQAALKRTAPRTILQFTSAQRL